MGSQLHPPPINHNHVTTNVISTEPLHNQRYPEAYPSQYGDDISSQAAHKHPERQSLNILLEQAKLKASKGSQKIIQSSSGFNDQASIKKLR